MAEEVEVSLLFFAKSRELTGVKESVLNVKQRTTAKEILEQILIKFPSLEVLSENLVLSLNEEYISVDDQIQMDHVEITEDKIDVDRVTSLVTDPSCGAISIFIGTTRDNFQGKKVKQLEYEAYDSMAKKEMMKICDEAHAKWNVKKVAMVHRIGVVPITEASIVIAVSSPHRKESLEAVQYGIDTLKATVPIWKKEIYEDGTTSWKENSECCGKLKNS